MHIYVCNYYYYYYYYYKASSTEGFLSSCEVLTGIQHCIVVKSMDSSARVPDFEPQLSQKLVM
jgi:hypothetical protein